MPVQYKQVTSGLCLSFAILFAIFGMWIPAVWSLGWAVFLWLVEWPERRIEKMRERTQAKRTPELERQKHVESLMARFEQYQLKGADEAIKWLVAELVDKGTPYKLDQEAGNHWVSDAELHSVWKVLARMPHHPYADAPDEWHEWLQKDVLSDPDIRFKNTCLRSELDKLFSRKSQPRARGSVKRRGARKSNQ